jgi:hypothetical protein
MPRASSWRSEAIGADRFFPTLGVAVDVYIRETGVEWRDWEDDSAPRPIAG